MLNEQYFEDPDTTATFGRTGQLRQRRSFLVNALMCAQAEDVDTKVNQFMFYEFAARVNSLIDGRVESQLAGLNVTSDDLRVLLRCSIADQVCDELLELHLQLPLPGVKPVPVLEVSV